ncbi:MAG TPA: trimethylamine methyltransferase family protein [Candidatus Limnocylindrales bacterium]|nr:trimethylamine methyltransferase family protein [Candidatus Limnocylindrales bacterium]
MVGPSYRPASSDGLSRHRDLSRPRRAEGPAHRDGRSTTRNPRVRARTAAATMWAMRPTLRVLEPELIDRILDEALRVLATSGMEVRGAELRRRLLAAGLPLDAAGERVLFPRDVVEAAIASAPSSFTLFDRDGSPHADLGGDRVHFVPGSSGLKVQDHRTGEVRLAGTTDFVEYVRLADGLRNIAYLATAFSTNDDIEVAVADAWRLFLVLTNSKRPVVSGAFTEHGVERMVEMQQLFRRDRADLVARPMSIFTITASGNFRYSEDSCQNLIDCVEAGIPVEIVPVTLQGLIAPVTTVGATVFHAVDVLAGITMAQVVRPGAPVLFGGAPATFHMKIASSPMAAIEALQLDVAYVEVAKALGLPCQSYMALSDAKVLDAQAGAETFGSALLAALAGVNSVSGPGMLDFLLVFSLPKLLFDDEVCGQVLHFVRDVHPVDDLPVDALLDQLRADQHLIMAEHTTAHWPTELYLPSRLWERDNRENWVKAGAADTAERAAVEVDRRLAAYQPVETDPVAVAELERIIRSGLQDQTELPLVPPADAPVALAEAGDARRRNRRRGG